MNYKHFSIEEREKIQELYWQKLKIREIAKVLKRSASSVSRELKRNFPKEHNRYTPRLAHERALYKRTRRGREERLKSYLVRNYVIEKMKLGWSPEQIASKCYKFTKYTISHEAIYQFVYARVSPATSLIYKKQEDLRPYLIRRRKQRKRQGMRSSYRIDKGLLPSIETRPLIVEERVRVGDWEDDCIVSRQSATRLKTINERRSGVVFITHIPNGTIEATNKAVLERLSQIPKKWRLTLTRDRGSENLGYTELQKNLGINCYFANAYHSWERGSNENANGLIRRFFPKKTDLSKISEEEIRRVEYLLNTRPRKRLGWKTPCEVFYELTGVALQY